MLYVGGNDSQGAETMGKELGAIVENKIPELLIELGKAVEASGLSYDEWYSLDKVEEIAKKFL